MTSPLSSTPPPQPSAAVRAKRAIRQSLTWFNWNQVLRGMFDVVCGGGSFLFIAFAAALGIPDLKMGRFTLAASLGCLFQIVVLPLLSRVGDRKRFILTLGVVEPLILMAGVLMTPMLPAELRLPALLLVVFIAAAFLNMTRPLMDDWVSSTIPAGVRGRYLGRRFQFFSVAIIIATQLAGWAGEHLGRNAPSNLAGILAAGGVFGLLSIAALSKVPMVKPAVGASSPRLKDLPRVFAEKSYRHYLYGMVIYNLPFFLTVPYYQVFFQRGLGMKVSEVGNMLTLYWVVKVFISGLAGRWSHRLGSRQAMLLIGPTYVAFFFLLVVANPERVWPVYLAWIVAGLGDATYNVASMSALFGVVPPTGARPAFFAVNNLLTLGLFAVGAPIAEAVLRALSAAPLSLGSLELGPYQRLFALSGLMMIPCMFGALLLIGRWRRGGGASRCDGPAI